MLIVIGALLAIALTVWALRRARDAHAQRQVVGGLAFDPQRLPAQTHALGAFILDWDAANGGRLRVHHPFLHCPDDPRVQDLSYQQFMVGSELMATPVLDPGVDQVRVYLPAGGWVHLWSGEIVGSPEGGRTATMPAPLGQPGVFYRAGSPVGVRFVENLRHEEVIVD